VIDLLRDLVELESPTGDTQAARDRLAAELERLGGAVTVEGDHLRADFAGTEAPLLLSGHFDTVWPRGTLEQMPWRVDDGRAYGPGVYDMKAGIVVMLEAIRLAETEHQLRVVLGDDELATRLREVVPPPPRYLKGVLARYAAGVSSASEGAVLK